MWLKTSNLETAAWAFFKQENLLAIYKMTSARKSYTFPNLIKNITQLYYLLKNLEILTYISRQFY